MDASPRIAIDAMGGDIGPAAMVAGMARARRKMASVCFEVFGDEALIKPELARHPGLKGAANIHHTTDAIHASEKPSQAIRRARKLARKRLQREGRLVECPPGLGARVSGFDRGDGGHEKPGEHAAGNLLELFTR